MAKNKRSKIKNETTKNHNKKTGELIALAHQGTQKSIKKISDFIQTTKSKDLEATAKIAKDEAEFFYYSPNNDQEKKDLLLAKIINDREDRLIMDSECKASAAKFELEKLDLERAVHQKLLKSLPKAKQKDWQYCFSEDYYQTVLGRLQEIEDDIDYEKKWIETAKKSIKTKKYLDLPFDFFQHYHWDYEDENFWSGNDLVGQPNEPEEPPF